MQRDFARVGRFGLKDDLVAAHLHGPHKHGVEELIILVALSGAHVDEFPLNILADRREALEAHLELEGVVEPSGVVEH